MINKDMKAKIVLASASPRRRELLTQIGVPFEVRVSDCEEVLTTDVPEEACRSLAEQKASAVAETLKQENQSLVIIGSDTVVACDGRILGKPSDKAEAAAMLRLLSGKTHQVCTGVCAIHLPEGKKYAFTETTEVQVADLSDDDIADYLETGEPFDKAGAYGIQGYFARYVVRIVGDYNNVVGLPVGRLYRECLADL